MINKYPYRDKRKTFNKTHRINALLESCMTVDIIFYCQYSFHYSHITCITLAKFYIYIERVCCSYHYIYIHTPGYCNPRPVQNSVHEYFMLISLECEKHSPTHVHVIRLFYLLCNMFLLNSFTYLLSSCCCLLMRPHLPPFIYWTRPQTTSHLE